MFFQILTRTNLIQIFPIHFFKINFNIISPSTPRPFKLVLSLKYPHQNSVFTFLLATGGTCRAHVIILFDHPDNICEEYEL